MLTTFVLTTFNMCDPWMFRTVQLYPQGDKSVLWAPIARGDIGWNFEKFLIGPDGKFVRRYSRYYLIDDIHADIDALL